MIINLIIYTQEKIFRINRYLTTNLETKKDIRDWRCKIGIHELHRGISWKRNWGRMSAFIRTDICIRNHCHVMRYTKDKYGKKLFNQEINKKKTNLSLTRP